MKDVTHLLWDNDGILVDTEQFYFQATRDVLRPMGVELTQELYVELFLRQSKGIGHFKSEAGIDEAALQKLRSERDEIYVRYIRSEARLMPDVQECLEFLGNHFVMSVVTSTPRAHLDVLHSKYDLGRHFERVITSEDYTLSKPHPEPYLTAMNKLGVSPDQCAAIEDSERGLQAAVAAGLRCIVVPTEITSGGDFSAAHRVLDSLSELESVLFEGR